MGREKRKRLSLKKKVFPKNSTFRGTGYEGTKKLGSIGESNPQRGGKGKKGEKSLTRRGKETSGYPRVVVLEGKG